MKRYGIYMMIIAVAAMAAGCGENRRDELQDITIREEDSTVDMTAVADYGDVIKQVTITTKYSSTESTDLAFGINGKKIEKVYNKNGDFVEAGQLMAEVELEDIEETLADMEYELSLKELELKHLKELKDYDILAADTLYNNYTEKTDSDRKTWEESKEEIEKQYNDRIVDTEDEIEIYRLRIEDYKEQLEQGRLYAPITGEITFAVRNLKDSLSEEGKTVFTISNLETCYFIADNDTYADYFEDEAVVTIEYRINGKAYQCLAYAIHKDQWDGNMYFKPETEDIIENNATGTINLLIDKKENVLCIPTGALHESDNGNFVYTYTDGLIEMRYVKVGLVGDDYTEILEGLSKGDSVALKK